MSNAAAAANDLDHDQLIQRFGCTDCAVQQMSRAAHGEPRFLAPARDSIVCRLAVRFVEATGFHLAPDEGDVYVRVSESPLMALTARFLTPPMRSFLELAALASDETLGGDAAISISWDDLGDRLASYDRLASQQPTLVFHDEAVERSVGPPTFSFAEPITREFSPSERRRRCPRASAEVLSAMPRCTARLANRRAGPAVPRSSREGWLSRDARRQSISKGALAEPVLELKVADGSPKRCAKSS